MAGKRKTIPRVWRGRKYKAPPKGKRIGAGKKGTGQRQIYRSGGNQNVLAAWQSISQPRRQKLKKAAAKNPKKKGLTQLVQQRVMKARKKAGTNPVTGERILLAGEAPQTGLVRPGKHQRPSRMRGW